MYPVLFRIGDFEITSFGVMVAVGALVGLWILHRELRRSALPPDALDAAIAGVVGGLAGAKLLWVLEHLHEEPVLDLLLSRGGMSWFGGFVGGILAGLAVMHRKRLPQIAVLAAATPALAFGHLIGRIGCFLVGDDYGRPSDMPWAVAFPQGSPRRRCRYTRRNCTRLLDWRCLDGCCSDGDGRA
jgi:phosphatidylglycerol---prolipoprotein diacylglyceryl transferase